jgi:hypothetical protein
VRRRGGEKRTLDRDVDRLGRIGTVERGQLGARVGRVERRCEVVARGLHDALRLLLLRAGDRLGRGGRGEAARGEGGEREREEDGVERELRGRRRGQGHTGDSQLTQCKRCWVLGHTISNCREKDACRECGSKSHHTTTDHRRKCQKCQGVDASIPCSHFCCVNCKGGHVADSPDCPTRRKYRVPVAEPSRTQISMDVA